MAGAGISVSAGIPDFRSPGTGLYDNLQEYGLPYPEAIFELDFFKKNPKPFFRLCNELWPGQYKPTPTHLFIAILHAKGLLRRCYTQNIDSLETEAGLPPEAIIAAHGNFDSASALADQGRLPVPIDEVRDAARAQGMQGWDALTEKYGGLVKPDIVFFGEKLPERFFANIQPDFGACDLLLVLGTSLKVLPFGALIGQVQPGTPRLLINRERVGDQALQIPGPAGSFDFDGDAGGEKRDGLFLGDCDDACAELVRLCGWQAEFNALFDTVRSRG